MKSKEGFHPQRFVTAAPARLSARGYRSLYRLAIGRRSVRICVSSRRGLAAPTRFFGGEATLGDRRILPQELLIFYGLESLIICAHFIRDCLYKHHRTYRCAYYSFARGIKLLLGFVCRSMMNNSSVYY
jgi:hypothetical protein